MQRLHLQLSYDCRPSTHPRPDLRSAALNSFWNCGTRPSVRRDMARSTPPRRPPKMGSSGTPLLTPSRKLPLVSKGCNLAIRCLDCCSLCFFCCCLSLFFLLQSTSKLGLRLITALQRLAVKMLPFRKAVPPHDRLAGVGGCMEPAVLSMVVWGSPDCSHSVAVTTKGQVCEKEQQLAHVQGGSSDSQVS